MRLKRRNNEGLQPTLKRLHNYLACYSTCNLGVRDDYQKTIRFAATSIPGGLPTLQACSSDTASHVSYAEASQRTWRHIEGGMSERSSLLHELVRYATLAASSHNSQCWKFHVEAHAISILPDLARRLPAVDPDDHHLYASLGCAVGNLIQAALANGLKGEAKKSSVNMPKSSSINWRIYSAQNSVIRPPTNMLVMTVVNKTMTCFDQLERNEYERH